jgi:uncharacterized protein YodC (DUF2158 family)
MKIVAGDVVTLKGSEVPMSVMKHDGGDGDIVCGWHDKNGQFQTHSFPQAVLAQTAATKAAHDKSDADVKAAMKAKAAADAQAHVSGATVGEGPKSVTYGGLGGPDPVPGKYQPR